MGQALEVLGYKVCHRAAPLRESLGHKQMINLLRERSLAPIYEVARLYNAFHDNPWFWLFKELDNEFPDSKFILTLRDEDAWLKSAKNYFGSSKSDFRELIYGKGSMAGNEERYLNRYIRHNEEVRQWFAKKPGRLLEIDITNKPEWSDICHFLEKPIPDKPFPHLNKNSSGGSKNINQAIKKLVNRKS